jgi:hypothetical protein
VSADEIMDAIEHTAGLGLEAGANFLLQQTEEVLSVPAPYKIVYARKIGGARSVGTPYRVATVPATPGSPPRLLNAILRGSGHVEAVSETEQQVVYGAPYGPWLEFEANHAFAVPTLEANLDALGQIIGEPFTSGVS